MDRIITIISYEWRAYWRRFSRAGLRAGNQGIILILSILITIKYLQLLRVTSADIEKGSWRSLAALLTGVFLVWLFPVGSSGRETLASRKWLHLPLSRAERFIVRSLSLLIPPSAWLVILGSLAICYPLAHARNPGAGIVAGLLFIAMAWLTGLTIAHLLDHRASRKLFWTAGIVLSAFAATYLIRGGAPADLLSLPFSPSMLVVRAAMGEVRSGQPATQTWFTPLVALAALAALSAGAACAALWSFKKSLASAHDPRPKTLILASAVLPGRLGGLVEKDFRYFRRLLDIYLGLAGAMLCCLYLVVADAPSAGVFWAFIVVVFLCNGALAFNCFGLDNRSGLDRYSLLPLNGRAILLSKNLAYLIISGLQMLPVLLLGGWRLGILTSALGLVETVALAFAYLSWGNWMSVTHPLKTQFFRFANSGAALVDAVGGITFGSAPGVLLIYLWHQEGARAFGGTALILLISGALYFVSLTRFGSRFKQKREQIAEALS